MGSTLTIDLPGDIITLDADAFDTLLRSQGVTLQHFRAIKCPIGTHDRFDSRHAGHDSGHCSNGFIYKLAGEVTVFLSNNSANSTLDSPGLFDGSHIVVVFPRYYDDKPESEVYVQIYDRFFLKDVPTISVTTELLNTNINGIDRLQYPILSIEHIMDSFGNEYGLSDYQIINGNINWSETRPGFDPTSNSGVVCSVRYRYRSHWYLKNLIHEIRVTRGEDFLTGERKVRRMPYAAVLQREYAYHNEQNFKNQVPTNRNQDVPEDGSFGAR